MLHRTTLLALLGAAAIGLGLSPLARGHRRPRDLRRPEGRTLPKVAHRTVKIDGLDIFYREAGPKDAPTILLLHGFPTSSHMFRNLIPALADEFHLVAPDYPGFGDSACRRADQFEYTFDNLADVVEKFTEKVGLKQVRALRAGLRRAGRLPAGGQAPGARDRARGAERQRLRRGARQRLLEADQGVLEGPREKTAEPLRKFLTLEATRWQYTHGARDAEAHQPGHLVHDQHLLDRPGNADIQLALFSATAATRRSTRAWQAYFRKHQPPTLIVWGKNDTDLPAGRRRAVPAGLEDHRVPPARHRPLRPRGRRRPDRGPHAGVPPQARPEEVSAWLFLDQRHLQERDLPLPVPMRTNAAEAVGAVSFRAAVPANQRHHSDQNGRITVSADHLLGELNGLERRGARAHVIEALRLGQQLAAIVDEGEVFGPDPIECGDVLVQQRRSMLFVEFEDCGSHIVVDGAAGTSRGLAADQEGNEKSQDRSLRMAHGMTHFES